MCNAIPKTGAIDVPVFFVRVYLVSVYPVSVYPVPMQLRVWIAQQEQRDRNSAAG